ncbi:MAG: hypothetical protein KDA93_00420 [Planctomycetaceae bacterium]|nr:hypothetical protein [Planctomycetaceae bacterium]
MAHWHILTLAALVDRFGEIMRLMDERYCALSTDELPRWLANKERNGKHPELHGWFEGESIEPAALRQVMATTCVKDAQGRRSDLGLSMLGVAADVIPESEWTDEHVEQWLGRFVLCVKSLIGLDVEFRAIRPKTMTWKPMERMHDLMKQGITLQSDDPEEGLLHSIVIHEKDIGHSIYWKMKTVRVDG